MKKLFIVLAALLGTLIGLLLVAAVIITVVIDPNDYREDVEQAVFNATGRELYIEEDLSLSFFPWLGVETGRMRLGNADGFDGDFFSLDGADVRLRLMPLLRRQVEVAEIRVDGVMLNLAVNAQGVSNWDDLTELDELEEPPEDEADAELDLQALERIRIGGLRLSDARLRWRDEAAGLDAQIDDWSLTLGEIRLGEPLDFETRLNFQLNEPALSGHFQAQATLMADLAGDGGIRIDDMDLSLEGEGEGAPISPLSLTMKWGRLQFDPQQAQLSLDDLSGELADMPFAGRVVVMDLDDAPHVGFDLSSGDFPGRALMPFLGDEPPEGLDLGGLETVSWRLSGELLTASDQLHINQGRLQLGELVAEFGVFIDQLGAEVPTLKAGLNLASFSPRRWLSAVGLEAMIPETRDPEVLKALSLQATLDFSDAGLSLNDLEILLDDSRISGVLRLPELDPPALRFDLHLDAIDLDRYLAPDEDAETVAEDKSLDLDAIEIPAEAIRGHDLEGRLRIDRLALAGMQLESVVAGLRIQDDVLRLAPIDAELYGGRQRGELTIDASGDVPSLRFTELLDGVAIDGLLRDLFDMEQFTGRANISMELSGQGRTVGELRPTLDGRMSLVFDDGALEGTDLAHAFSDATKRFRSDEQVRPDRGRTPFSTLAASGTVEEGRLTSEDVGLTLETLSLRGSGWLSLVDLSMDYRLSARLQDGASEDMAADDFELEGRALSLRMTGTPVSPRFRFDTEGLLESMVGERRREAEAEAREEAREAERRAREEAEEARDRLRERLRERGGR